jgi:ribonuclease J
MEEVVMDAVLSTFDTLPRPQKRDPDVLAEAVRRAVRSAVNEAWGKKPVCTVFVAVV